MLNVRRSLLRSASGAAPMAWSALTTVLVVTRVAPLWAVTTAAASPGESGLLASGARLAAFLVACGMAERLLRGRVRLAASRAMHMTALDALLDSKASVDAKRVGDAQYQLFNAIDAGELLVVDAAPNVTADAFALVACVPLVLRAGAVSNANIAALAVPVILGAVVLAAIRQSAPARWLGELESAYARVVDGLVMALRAGEELRVNGADARVRTTTRESASAWSDAAARWALLQFALSRVPLVLAFATVVAWILTTHPTIAWQGAVLWGAVGTLLVSVSAGAHRVIAARLRMRHGQALLAGEVAAIPDAVTKAPSLETRVSANALSYRYAGATRDAVRAQSFAWKPGRIVCIVGANGSGKSTLLRLIAGALEPTSGTLTRGAESIAYLSAAPYFPDTWTVRQSIALYAPTGAESLDTPDPVLHATGVSDRRDAVVELDAPIATLSLGQRKRVALARVLLRHARLVLLDEPDAHLDTAGVAALGALLRTLSRESLVVLAAHGEAIRGFADDVVELPAPVLSQ